MRRVLVDVPFSFLTIALLLTLTPRGTAAGQDLTASSAESRVTQPIDETQLEAVKGQVHPLARAEFDQGVVDDSMPVEHLIVLLKRTPEQEQAAALLVDQLHNRHSPTYHGWISAEEYGKRFGPTDDDLAKLTGWLQSKGFTIEDVPPGRTHITISGNAGMVREAFHTEIHNLFVNGEKQKAVLADPQVPTALAPIVAGFLQLHSWHPKPLHHDAQLVKRQQGSGGWAKVENQSTSPDITFTYQGSPYFAVTPQDWNTIYNANPLLQAGITGAGQTIAVLEETEVVHPSDIASFRSQFGLPAYPATPSSTAGGINWIYGPGNGCTAPPKPTSTDEEGEALLDTEWAGAVAPKAIVDFVACNTTGSAIGANGTDLAASHVANYLYSTVVAASLSYGLCELEAGSSGTAYYSMLYQQMAAAGITVVVSSGDSGATGCDQGTGFNYALSNLSSNALGSTPYNLSAGGTDFSDSYQGTNSLYWNNNGAAPYGSALSYVPEMPWGGECSSPLTASFLQALANTSYGTTYTPLAICNEAHSSDPYGILIVEGAGGGVSAYNSLPTWQSAYGVGLSGNNTSTSHRNQPDISFFASSELNLWGHGLLFCQSDNGAACTYSNTSDAIALAAGGTSFVAPQVAGLMALINQSAGSRQGVANYTLYSLAAHEYGVPGSPSTTNLANCSGSMLGASVGKTCIFHDIDTTPNPLGGAITGNTVEPCEWSAVSNCWRSSSSDSLGLSSVGSHPTTDNPGYSAGPGYDLATGLGSANIYNLVANWNLAVSFASITSLATPNPASIASTASTMLTATVTATGRGSVSPALGTVAFYLTNGSVTRALLGTVTLSQSCTGSYPKIKCAAAKGALTVAGSLLNPGANSIIAKFSGDGANDAPSTSGAVTVTVTATAQNVTTLNPTAVTSSFATLNGTVNPANAAGSAYFQWGTSSTLTTSTSTTAQPVVKNTIVQPFSAAVSALTSGTTYYFRMVFHNTTSSTYSYGAIRSFKPLLPVAATFPATGLSRIAATLNGKINPQGSPGKAYFQWGKSSTLISPTSTALVTVTTNMTAQSFSAALTGLSNNTTYYFRVVYDDTNTSSNTYGAIRSFKTSP